MATAAPQPPADTPTFGDRWAFRSFVLLFLLTLLIGFGHFILSWWKFRS